MIFTPLSKTGKRRLKYECKPYNSPRGISNADKVFYVETIKGRILKAKVVACSLSTCYCDAQLIDDRKD